MTKYIKEGNSMGVIIAIAAILIGMIAIYYGINAIVAGIIALLTALGLKRD